MEYILFVCTDPDGPPYVAEEDNIEEWVTEMDSRGARKYGEPLRPAKEATTVTVRNGEVIVTEGPFAETKGGIAGFDLIDCADLQEAIEIASKHPMAKFGKIEIRPIWQLA